MNTTAATVNVSPEIQARRDAATASFKEKAHNLYHLTNGESAACHMCGNVAKGQKGFAI